MRSSACFSEVRYAAQTWDTPRRVIVKAEHSARGSNPRFVVTNLTGNAQRIYDRIYCARGEMENRIKEQQLDLFADRTSCHTWWANQFRLLLSSLAYTLLETIRRVALHATALARAQCGTLRLKLLRIGAIVLRKTRRIPTVALQCLPQSRTVLPGGRSPQAGIVVPTPVASCSIPCESGCRSPPKRLVHRNRR